MESPCLDCGACCAYFRVAFYWAETRAENGASVPETLTEAISPFLVAMRGTLSAPVRCIALEGTPGRSTRCTIYPSRPSPCRDLNPWRPDGEPDEKCQRARSSHGLPPLPSRVRPTLQEANQAAQPAS
ncbi:MAG: YkgJ family cysteine cluster protein [Pseudomonadota bacterium]